MHDLLLRQFLSERTSLLGYLRLLLPADRVEDAFQDTFLIVSRRLADFDQTREFGPWVRGIARHVALKHREAAGRMVAVDPTVLADRLEQAFVEEAADPIADTAHEDLRHLDTCLQELRDPQRELIRRRYQGGESLSQLALSTGRSEGAVQVALSRLRAVLFACISRQRKGTAC